jgi:hypothetical protein
MTMTRSLPRPTSSARTTDPIWILCERCGLGAQCSPYRAGWCLRCAPPPEYAAELARQVHERHQAAVAAAERSGAVVVAGHAWIDNRHWRLSHLFEYGEKISYCEAVRVSRGVMASDSVNAATKPPCGKCVTEYETFGGGSR